MTGLLTLPTHAIIIMDPVVGAATLEDSPRVVMMPATEEAPTETIYPRMAITDITTTTIIAATEAIRGMMIRLKPGQAAVGVGILAC